MKVTLTNKSDNTVIYHQVVEENSGILQKLLGLVVQAPAGDKLVVMIQANGKQFPFEVEAIDTETVIRTVNGFIIKNRSTAKAETTAQEAPAAE